MTRPKGIKSERKGKTYEEIYGKEEAIAIKNNMKKPKSVPSYKKDKTWEEIFGKEKGKEMKKECSERQKGRKVNWGNKISIGVENAHKRKQFGYKKGEQKGIKNPMKRPEVRKKQKQNVKRGKDNYFAQHIFSKEKNWNWKSGISYEPYGFEFNEELKKLIRKRDNSKCQICGKYGKDVHHIDYNKKNNDPKNLITLCHKCHSKTGHNRKIWLHYFKEMLNGKK